MNINIRREDLNFILQKSNFQRLKELYKTIKNRYEVVALQAPTQQTLLQPINDPISKGEFYGGEVLVTTAIVTVGSSKNKGWAMVMDDNEKLSLYIATCDGAFGAGYFKDDIKNLAKETQKQLEENQKKENQKINSTRVNFDLMG